MAIGLVGRKCGMTRLFTEAGAAIPVTVIEIKPNLITQLKTREKEGYQALQVTTGKRKISRVNKPMAGHFAKAKTEPGEGLWEFRFEGELPDFINSSTAENSQDNEVKAPIGSEIPLSLFKEGQLVDVTSKSKGKGFAGVIKRHNFASQDASHGNSLSHRAPGSIGQNQSPGRVFKGKKMAGRLGNTRVTVQNLEVIRVDDEKRLILIKGAVPGPTGARVILCPAVKLHGGEKK